MDGDARTATPVRLSYVKTIAICVAGWLVSVVVLSVSGASINLTGSIIGGAVVTAAAAYGVALRRERGRR